MSPNKTFLASIAGCLSTAFGMCETGKPITRLSLFAAGMLFAAGCAANADNTLEVTLDKNFELRVGESALVSDENLQIGFKAVLSDSRCAKGVVCIWEGDAAVRIWLQLAGKAKQERDLHTASREPNAADYLGYSVRLVAVYPLPVSGRTIAPTEYIAILEIIRGSFGGNQIY